MQAISPVTSDELLAKVKTSCYKLEVYDGTTWYDLCALGSPAKCYVDSLSCTPGGAGPSATIIAGSWSATLKNPDGIFHPLHPSSEYAGLLQAGRQVRISTGGLFKRFPAPFEAWSNRKLITIPAVAADIVNSTVLVSVVSDADIGAACRADGFDLCFTSADGITALTYERKSFSVSGGLATGVFWVKSNVYAAGTQIWCYYGNPNATDGSVSVPVTYIGQNDSGNGHGTWSANYIRAFRTQNTAGKGVLTEIGINLYSAYTGSVRVGVYAGGDSTTPGTLLLDAGELTNPSAGWNTISGLSLAVDADAYYWLAVINSAASFPIYYNTAYTMKYKSYTYAALPASWTPSATVSNRPSIRAGLSPADGGLTWGAEEVPTSFTYTKYYWRRLIGFLTEVDFNHKDGTVSLKGDDFCKPLEDSTLEWPNNYWGEVATFNSIASSGVTGTEIYAEADALRIASEVNSTGDWDDSGGLIISSVADTGGGSTYVMKFVRDAIGGIQYAHESNVGSVTVGEQYFISFKAKPVTGTGWTLKIYQTVSGTLTLIDTVYLDGAAAYSTHSLRITALKTGALEMRLCSSAGSEGNELRLDQMSIALYEAAWNTYQLPDDCNGPYYVTLGQFASVQKDEIATVVQGTEYRIKIKYERVSGSSAAWIGLYQTVSSVVTLVKKIPLTSFSWGWATATFEALKSDVLAMRVVSEDGEEDDEIRLDTVSLKLSSGGDELYVEEDALDSDEDNEANNVSDWTVLSGCTFEAEADDSGGSAYVAVFKRTGSFNEQVTQGSRDSNGDFDGWLYNNDTKIFKFDQDRYVENGTANLNIYYYTSQAPENMVADILVMAGDYADRATALAAMDYTATGILIERPRFEAGTTKLEAIRMLAERCNYRFWIAYDGTPCFKPAPAAKDTPDFTFTSWSNFSSHNYKQDKTQVKNQISIEGDAEEPFAVTSGQRDSKLSATAEDQDSIDENGLKTESISNVLFQDAASIIAMCAALLAEKKDAKWYVPASTPKPVPLEVGDTIQWTVPVGGTDFILRGVIQSAEIKNSTYSYKIEVT